MLFALIEFLFTVSVILTFPTAIIYVGTTILFALVGLACANARAGAAALVAILISVFFSATYLTELMPFKVHSINAYIVYVAHYLTSLYPIASIARYSEIGGFAKIPVIAGACSAISGAAYPLSAALTL